MPGESQEIIWVTGILNDGEGSQKVLDNRVSMMDRPHLRSVVLINTGIEEKT
jgi:hypothetical protein